MFDKRVLELLPHRPPMLLIQRLIAVSANSSDAELSISSDSPFFEHGRGVPAWIGLEYMGQTAALIAGYQLEQGLVEPHLGFVLGTRRFRSTLSHFPEGAVLSVSCRQLALVGGSLANFSCEIKANDDQAPAAEAALSVIRKALPNHE